MPRRASSKPRVLVIGGGHNGLVCAAYLARGGADVTVLEARGLLGGACVTEELWQGYRVSRGAYVLSLFRPQIARDLELERHGLVVLPRSPSSMTPLGDGRALVLGADTQSNVREIARFSTRDAEAWPRYEAFLGRVARAFEPLLDRCPPQWPPRSWRDLRTTARLGRSGLQLGGDLPEALRLLTGSARSILEQWFESEPLRATLATDAVIGAFASPSDAGTGYVLFHHVMGSIAGERGVWSYVRGGMGGLAEALARSARAAGAELRVECPVGELVLGPERRPRVVLRDGEEIDADAVVSTVDPARLLGLLPGAGAEDALGESYVRALRAIDYRSPVVKINMALRRAPRFRIRDREEVPLAPTIHLGATDLDGIDRAFAEARAGRPSQRPIVELTLPSSVDDSLAPPGHHVASVFAQYAPARPMDDAEWPALGEQMQHHVLAILEEAAPGFSESIEHIEVLTPPRLEEVFGLTGGNIFHGAMTPDRLFLMRPVAGWSRYRTPAPGLYLGGAAAHPGGGVLGAPGRNAARELLRDLRSRRVRPHAPSVPRP